MLIYNLIEYSKNYKKQQEVCGIITEISLIILLLLVILLLLIIMLILYQTLNLFKTLNNGNDYMKIIKGKKPKNVETVVPLKYLSNFWRILDMLLF